LVWSFNSLRPNEICRIIVDGLPREQAQSIECGKPWLASHSFRVSIFDEIGLKHKPLETV